MLITIWVREGVKGIEEMKRGVMGHKYLEGSKAATLLTYVFLGRGERIESDLMSSLFRKCQVMPLANLPPGTS